MKKDYTPKNKLSKRYQVSIPKILFSIADYEAGGYYRWHKTRTKDNQMLSQWVRTREKEKLKIEIKNALKEYEFI